MVQGTEYGVESTEYQAGALLTLIVIMIQVRRELYAQCLDELIRETTISCVERGLLMLRLRDEARMTLHAYMVSSVVGLPSTGRGEGIIFIFSQ